MAGLLDFLNTDEGRLGLGLLAAGGPTAQPMGFGERIQMAMQGQDAYKRDALKTKQAEQGLLKSGLELETLMDGRRKDRAISERMAKLNEEEGGAQGGGAPVGLLAAAPASDPFGTPSYGGLPMFSMQGIGGRAGAGSAGSFPAARIDGNEFVLAAQKYQLGTDMNTMNKIVGLVNDGMSADEAARQVAGGGRPPLRSSTPTQPAQYNPLMVGTNTPPGSGEQQPSALQGQYQRMLKQARIYEEGGRPDMALKILQAAQQFQPEYSTEFRQVMDPVSKKLINVQVSKDGTIRPVPFGVKPDISLENLGGTTVAIDKNAARGGQSWDRTMTPGEVASNRVAQGNLRVAQDRLTLDRDAPQYITQDGVTFAVPKRPQPGAPIIGRPVVGMDGESLGGGPKLTEGQARAMTFAARMVDSNKVLDQLEGEASPSSVMRGAYKPNFPAWMPGGQLAAAGMEATNRLTTPQAAQQLYQAQTNWVTANLRKESGAVIGPEEMQTEIRKWFGQPGEPQAVLDQKRAARRVAQESMVAEAGPGAKQIPGILGRAAESEKSRQGQGSSGKAMASLPTANLSNKGRKVRDNETGKLYQSNGMSWQEVR